MTTPSLASAVRAGLDDFDGLDDGATFLFEFWITNLVHGYDNVFYQYRAGMLDDERWEVQRASLGILFSNPGPVQWWRSRPQEVSPVFIALVEEVLGEEPDRGE